MTIVVTANACGHGKMVSSETCDQRCYYRGFSSLCTNLIVRPIELDIPERAAGRGLSAKPGFDDHRRLSEIADADQ